MKFASFPTCVMIVAGVAALAGAADARQVLVEGHYRPNGSWVPPHYRTVPDGPGYEGPAYVNPYTGAATGNPYPYANPYTNPYQSPYQAPYQAPYQGTYVPPVAPGAPAPYYGAP